MVLDDVQLAALGSDKKTANVRVTVNGHTFPGRIARMRGETLLGFSRAVREACDGPQPDLRSAFDALAYSHRKEFVRWISEAKQDATRERRITETLAMLAEGRTRR